MGFDELFETANCDFKGGMMRTFKFRAWDKEFEMMFYSNSSDDPLNVTGERIHHLCGCEKPEGHLNYFFFEKAPIMQFTGLHDKNGKEIYEGDVIKLDNEPNYYVIFEKGCFLGKEIKGWDSMVDNFPIGLQSQIGEVIGNVYEHPDLLKGE